MTITPVGETTRNVAPGDSVMLEVDASCTSGGITYQWYEYTYNQEYDYWMDTVPIDGATGDTYETITLYENKAYACYIYDEYRWNR